MPDLKFIIPPTGQILLFVGKLVVVREMHCTQSPLLLLGLVELVRIVAYITLLITQSFIPYS